MTRTRRYKLQYLAALVLLLVLAASIAWSLRDRPALVVVVGLVLFIPGRLSGFLWRDLYRGRRLIQAGEASAGLESSRNFIQLLAERPGLRGLWWLAWAVYSRDPKAMAFNNVGSAHLNLGQLEAAEAAFREAIQIDPEYPIPYSNLAALCTLRGEPAEAEAHAQRAIALGYSRNAVDRTIQSASSILAEIEGRGPGSGGSRADA